MRLETAARGPLRRRGRGREPQRDPRGPGRARAATRRRSGPRSSSRCTRTTRREQGWDVEPLSDSPTRARRDPRGRRADLGRRRLRAASLRERRPPRAARSRDRGAGAGAHVDRDRRRAAGGLRGRRRDQGVGPQDRRVPVVGPRRPERQQDLVGDPHHAPPDRPRRRVPGRAVAAQEPRAGADDPPVAPLRGRDRGAREAASPEPARRRSARETAPRRSAPTTSRRTG